MSTQFDFMLMCNLRDDIPTQVVDTLKYMLRTEAYEFNDPPDDPIFESDWWRTTLLPLPLNQHLGKFSGDEIHLFRRDFIQWGNGTKTYYYSFHLRVQMHGDIMHEYLLFANWLAQFSERVGFVGYYHSQYAINEGTDPNLLYFVDGKLKITRKINPEF